MINLSKLSEMMWRRHANPMSIWTRLLSTPLAFLPFWNRSVKQGFGVAAWFAINPWLFPEPKDKDAWGACAIRGERRWTKERPRDASLVVQSMGAVAFLGGFYFAYKRRFVPTVLSAVIVMASNTWFLDRMAKTYGAAPYKEEAG